jgi:hypothetical protein
MLEPARICWLSDVDIRFMGSASYLSRSRFRQPCFCPPRLLPELRTPNHGRNPGRIELKFPSTLRAMIRGSRVWLRALP